MKIKIKRQNSMRHTGNSYAAPAAKVMEIRFDGILAASSIEDYEENIIS